MVSFTCQKPSLGVPLSYSDHQASLYSDHQEPKGIVVGIEDKKPWRQTLTGFEDTALSWKVPKGHQQKAQRAAINLLVSHRLDPRPAFRL